LRARDKLGRPKSRRKDDIRFYIMKYWVGFAEEASEQETNLEDLRVEGKMILKWTSRNTILAWNGLIWLKKGIGGGHL